MSWFSDLTGKAEIFLNAIDQSAGKALNTEKKKNDTEWCDDNESFMTIPSQKTGSSSSSASISIINSNGNGSNGHRSQSSSRGHTRTSSFESIGSNASKGSSSAKTMTTGVSGPDDDEKLFEYLNAKNESDTKDETRDDTIIEGDNDDDDEPIVVTEPIVGETIVAETSYDIKGQIRSLNNEIALLNRRNIELETECKRLQKRIINLQSHMSSSDSSMRELQSRESDLKASLDAKDSQIGVLKIRLQEVDDELRAKMRIIKELETISETLRTASETSVTNANESIVEYHQRMQQLESDLFNEREHLKRIQSDSMVQIGHFEDNQKTLTDEIANLQRNVNTEKHLNHELQQKLQMITKKFHDIETEFNDFKLKAKKTLQDKDDLLKALNKSQINTDNTEVQQILQSQCDAMIIEISDLREKNENLKKSYDRVTNDEIPVLNTRIMELIEELDNCQRIKMDLEMDLKQVTDESKYFQDDLFQTKNQLSMRIVDRDNEIEKLRKQLMSVKWTPTNSGGQSVEELESRVRNLTDNLIQKQTLMEQLASEKNSLSLQLERSETRLRELMSNQRSSEVSIGIHHSPSFSNLVNRNLAKPLIDDDPRDSHVTRRVKRAYGHIDAFSIRLGNFLRVYPSARAALLLYVLLLHIWVMFVLFYYEPEIHGSNYMPTMETKGADHRVMPD